MYNGCEETLRMEHLRRIERLEDDVGELKVAVGEIAVRVGEAHKTFEQRLNEISSNQERVTQLLLEKKETQEQIIKQVLNPQTIVLVLAILASAVGVSMKDVVVPPTSVTEVVAPQE